MPHDPAATDGASPALVVLCHRSLEAVGALRSEINALNLLSAVPDPFSTLEFYEAYFRHDEFHPAGRGMELWFLVAQRGGQVVGYVALKRVPRRSLGRDASTISFLVVHDTDRPHVVARPEDRQEVTRACLEYLLLRSQEWSLLEFTQQDAATTLLPLPAGFVPERYRVADWPTLENATIPVRWATPGAYGAALARKFRVNLARQWRQLLAAGTVELLDTTDPAGLGAAYDLYLRVESHSWKSLAQVGVSRDPLRVEYVRALLAPMQPMSIRIQVLILDGVPVAGRISGLFDGCLYVLHLVYDERVARFGAGSAMVWLAVREAVDLGLRRVNLLSGLGHFKVRWLAELTPTRVIQVYRAGRWPAWHRRLGDLKRRLWRWRRPAASAAAVVHGGSARAAPQAAVPTSVAFAPEERVAAAALVAEVRRHPGHPLDAPSLARALSLVD